MIEVSRTAILLAGAVLALWFAAALYTLVSGLKLRRRGYSLRDQADRLAALLQSASAIPMLVRADGKIEAPARLAAWMGLPTLPTYLSELVGATSCLAEEEGAALVNNIASAQRGAKSFSITLNIMGSSRTLLVKGAPAAPDLANPGAAILWFFDATESQARIDSLEKEGGLLHDALEALSGLIEAAPMPMWHRDGQLRLGLVNSAYVRAVEAPSAADVIEQQIELFETIDGLPPAEAARITRDKQEVLTRVVPTTVGGERRMMQVVEVPMGRVGVAGYAIDRQDYESARTEQARTVASQRDMLDRLTAAVAQFGPDRSLIFWNKAFVTLFALQPEHLIDRPEFERVLDRMREGGRIPEHRDFPAWRSERRA